MNEKIVKFFNYAFTLFFGVIFINCIFKNKKSVIEFNMKIVFIISILFLIVILGIYLCVIKNKGRIKRFYSNKKSRIITGVVAGIVILGIQIIIARCFYYPVGWDVKILRESAQAMFFNESVDYLYF